VEGRGEGWTGWFEAPIGHAAVAAASTNPFPPSPTQAAPAALDLSELTAIGPLDG